jgi:hypothetical protein
MATLSEAKAAKARTRELLGNVDQLRGLGIARTDDGFGVKVNLQRELDEPIPEQIDGVPLVVEIVGTIRPRADDAPDADPADSRQDRGEDP